MPFKKFAVLFAVIGLLGSACGTDDSDTEGTPEASAEASATLSITAVDYAFQGIGTDIEAGSKVEFKNASSDEVHEVVAFKLADGETRSADEMVKLSEEELMGAVTLKGVAMAWPTEDAVFPEGPIDLSEPGRYLFMCFLPVGGDPDAIRTAVESTAEGKPDYGDGPPHFTEGMYAEATVA